MRFLLNALLLTTVLLAMGCKKESHEQTDTPSAKYGVLMFGDENIPIEFIRVSADDDWVMLLLSPITDSSNLTTSAIIGLRSALVGECCDVERHYCQDDYIVVYEDPLCYYAPYRSLRSGSIYMQLEDNSLAIDLDVVLCDGTSLRYSHDALPLKEASTQQ